MFICIGVSVRILIIFVQNFKNKSMNIAELKMEMVEIISQTYDEPTVNRLYAKIHEIIEAEQEGWNDLLPNEQKKLDAAIKETYDPSKLVSHEDALKMIDQWLKK